MSSLLRIKRTDSYKTMNTGLPFKVAERIWSVDLYGDALDSTLVFLHIEDFTFKAMTLGPSEIHPHKHARPVGCLRSSRSRMDGEIEVVLVELAIKKGLGLERFELLCNSFYLTFKLQPQILILFRAVKLYELAQVLNLRDEILPWVVAVLECVEPLVGLLCIILVIPEIRRECLLLLFFYLILNPGLFKDASILGRLLPLRYRIQLCSLKTYITPCFYSPHFSI